MPQVIDERKTSTGAPVDAIAAHLKHNNEVIRCAAVRAYAANAAPTEARGALLEALTDPDPDIRSDAMERLVGVARHEDAEMLRASLEGDPVREVKLAAIQALSQLNDQGVIPLFQKLIHSRCNDIIAWEDDGGDWDDWLDIQIAAIKALGTMQVSDAIDDILAARKDEFGQDLDGVAFETLCRLGAPGASVLLKIIQTETDRPARRALAALVNSDGKALLPFIDDFLKSDNPDIRAIALCVLPSDDPRAADLAAHDPAPAIRCKALQLVASAQPNMVEAALHDPVARVQAEALTLLVGKVSPDMYEALVDNLLVWLRHAKPELASAAATALPRFAPNRCEIPLQDVLLDTEIALETRMAAVNALASKVPPAPTAVFADILANPARQVRTAALAELARRSETGDAVALHLLASAIHGELNTERAAPLDELQEGADANDAAMPKGEGGPRRIRITRDGDIEEGETVPQISTLQEIISADAAEATPVRLAEDTPEEAPVKRRRRQPVEGPDDFGAQFQLDAIGVATNTCNEAIESALLASATRGHDDERRAAWTALSKWSPDFQHSDAVRKAAVSTMQASDTMCRAAAFDVLAKAELPPDALQLALDSDDALLRAAAVGQLAPQAAFEFVADNALAVRQVAVERIVADGTSDLAQFAVERLAKAERTDTLSDLFSKSEPAWLKGLSTVNCADQPKQILVLLEAFAGLGMPGSEQLDFA